MLQWFYIAKSVSLGVNASLRWLNNVSGVLLNPGFLASYWSAGFGRFLQVSALASHWHGDCANFTTTPEGKQPTQRRLLLVQYKQQVNPLLSTCPSRETVPLNDYANIIPGSTNHCWYSAWRLKTMILLWAELRGCLPWAGDDTWAGTPFFALTPMPII